MPARFELPVAQRSHFVAFVCTLLVAVFSVSGLEIQKDGYISFGIRIVHLAAFSSWLGTQLWVSFIAGVTMYKNLPRHMFGFIQSKLFPKYFLLGTVLMSLSIVTFIAEHPFGLWNQLQYVQILVLVFSLLMCLANLLYLEPATTKTTFAKHEMEKKVQAGQAVGKLENSHLDQLNKNPEYTRLTKRFVTLHSVAALCNLLSLCAQGVHMLCLASHLATI